MREGLQQKEKKIKPEGKVKHFFKKLARKAVLPLTAAACLTFTPVAKHINPFHSKPALADELTETKPVTNDSHIRLGGQLVTNEAGAVVAALSSYRDLAGVNLGFISFFEGKQKPFLTFTVTPGFEKKGFMLKNSLSVTFADINSWLYVYEALGVGYCAKFSDKWRLTTAVMGGGAVSYPTADNIHFKVMWGTALNWNDMITGYLVAESYFGANTPQKTAYVMNYKMRFQSIEGGVVGTYKNLIGIAFAKYDVIQSVYGAKFGAILNITDQVMGHLWVGGGASVFAKELGGKPNFVLLAGINLRIKGRLINTDWHISHEQLGPGGTPMLPEIDSPPYTKPKTPEQETWEEEAKSNFMTAGSFKDFVESYGDASDEKLLIVARWLGRNIGQVGYELDAMNSLMKLRIFDDSVKRVAGANYEDVYDYMHTYFELIDTYGYYDNIPEELRNTLEKRVAICTIIHAMGATMLNANGIHALVASVNSPGGPHTVTLGNDEDIGTFIIDYDDYYETKFNSLPGALNMYGRHNNIPTFYSVLFKPDIVGLYLNNLEYMGTYKTASGRLMEDSIIGVNIETELKSFFLFHKHH